MSLKRKTPTPHSPHQSVGASLLSSDRKLLPRIHSFLSSLDPSVSNVSPAHIVTHLRDTYPEYARKPAKPFAKGVEALCEKMRQEALAEAEQAQAQAQQQSASSSSGGGAGGDSMTDIQDVQIISSHVASDSSNPLAISFAALPASTPTPPSASAPAAFPSFSSPTAGTAAAAEEAAAKRRRQATDGISSIVPSPGSTPTGISEDGGMGGESDSEGESVSNSVIELDAAGANTGTPTGTGGVNNAMRNLYSKAAALQQGANAASEAAAAGGASSSGGGGGGRSRSSNSKEKIPLTQNSTRKNNAKKKKPPVTFTQHGGSAEDAALAHANNPNDGGGSNWHPDVLYPTSTYADLGGIESILQEIRELVEYPLSHPEIYQHLGVEAPRGILLHGPPGCGKTLLAHCIAGELRVPLLKISAPEVVSGMSGESEQKIRTLFQDALDNAPCLLFIDEIDAITPKRATAQREMERRMVAQLLTSMDSLSTSNTGDPTKIVIVLGATNRPDSLDPALRRAGRFDREISLGIPDEAARARILSVMCRGMKVEGGQEGFDWASIAKKAVGYVGADLMALTREAAVLAINRIFKHVLPTPALGPAAAPKQEQGKGAPPRLCLMEDAANSSATPSNEVAALSINTDANGASPSSAASAAASASPSSSTALAHPLPDLKSTQLQRDLDSRAKASEKLRAHIAPLTPAQLEPLSISYADFDLALKKVQPSSKREGFATIPDVTWNDIGALDSLREELNMTILQPILNPLQFESIGLTVPAGVLLFGPPGCGKTLVAKAIANESGASFLSIKGPELLNQYVGESERAVRSVFQRARASSPCVIFFDELDALVPKRGASGESGGSQVSERVVNQLLTEMDGLEERRFVFVIAATNRPDIIDPAMLRPGRLDKLLYVKLPSAPERAAILRKHLRRTPLSPDVDITKVAEDVRSEGFSGADIAALVREATLQALREAQQAQRDELAKAGVVSEGIGWASMSSKSTEGGKPTPKIAPVSVLVRQAHFDFAFTKVFPSVSPASRARYDRMHKQLCRARSTLTNEQPANANGGDKATLELVEEEKEEKEAGAAAAPASATPAAAAAPAMDTH